MDVEDADKEPPPRPKRCPNCGCEHFAIYGDFVKCAECNRTLIATVKTKAW
ncbi:MAG: hypothetical protein GH150_04760 [Hadesarchaea archaeon]|nr:hypothetical protein [Hadesarchaea archaeon]